ncbi:hypothetical protein [Terracoccus sp. 273MFTsu3.1]|uniref:hypothetical protein n=1 Tax=Terracoccus sp. 273MFTsu3.1 TaxID=1172188 RepID=UPI00039F9A23|nr:hypothetical protein [Terracoccus sp. 273MFTsu3.1]
MRPSSMKNHVGETSAFRATKRTTRIHEAHALIAERTAEIEALLAALDVEPDRKARRVLTLRLQGTRRNLASWEAYVAKGSEREGRAVMGRAA